MLVELKVGLPNLYGSSGTCTMSQPASLSHGAYAIHLPCAASLSFCARQSLSCPAASKQDRSGELTADSTEEESHSSGEESEEDSDEDDGMTASRKAKQAAGRLHLS